MSALCSLAWRVLLSPVLVYSHFWLPILHHLIAIDTIANSVTCVCPFMYFEYTKETKCNHNAKLIHVHDLCIIIHAHTLGISSFLVFHYMCIVYLLLWIFFFFNLNLTYVIFSMPKHLYVFKKEKKTLCRKKIHIEIILLISNFVLAVLQIWTVCSEIVYQQGTM